MNTARSTLKIILRHGIWRIWLDGKFFADYRSKREAEEGAAEAQRAMAAAGRRAQVVFAPDANS